MVPVAPQIKPVELSQKFLPHKHAALLAREPSTMVHAGPFQHRILCEVDALIIDAKLLYLFSITFPLVERRQPTGELSHDPSSTLPSGTYTSHGDDTLPATCTLPFPQVSLFFIVHRLGTSSHRPVSINTKPVCEEAQEKKQQHNKVVIDLDIVSD